MYFAEHTLESCSRSIFSSVVSIYYGHTVLDSKNKVHVSKQKRALSTKDNWFTWWDRKNNLDQGNCFWIGRIQPSGMTQGMCATISIAIGGYLRNRIVFMPCWAHRWIPFLVIPAIELLLDLLPFWIDRNANCQENRVDESTSNKLTLFNHTILQDTTINDQNYDIVTKSLFLLSVNFTNLIPFW